MADGTVAAFDQGRGYGTIRSADGRDVFFHCTRIADGSRTIEVGMEVSFGEVPGHGGHREAADVTPR